MGIVQRQGIKQSVVTSLGVILGVINLFFIYTTFLNQTQIGFITIMRSIVTTLLPFVVLGSSPLIVRYFPYFKSKDNSNNGFLFLILLLPIVSFSIIAFLYILFQDAFLGMFTDESNLLQEYGIYILPWLFAVSLSSNITRYIANFKRIVVPAIFNDLFVKISVPIYCLLYFYGVITFTGIIQVIVFTQLVVLLALVLYLNHLGQLSLRPQLGFLKKKLLVEMATYNVFGIIGSIGITIVLQIDTLMVGFFLGYINAAIYTIPLFMSNVIDIPKRAITSITSPIISEAWKENDMSKIEELYTKTSINQFIPGLLILVGMWASVDQLFSLIPEGPNSESYIGGKYIVLILGTSRLFDMVTGVNTEIIAYSKFYKFNFYSVIFLAIFTIISNLILIPPFGINGAALATMLSYILFNFIKVVFLKIKFNIQPFRLETLYVLLTGLFVYSLTWLLPDTGNNILDIVINSILVLVSYTSIILYFNLSTEVSELVRTNAKKIFGR